jgi:hypothetical protein
MSCCKKCEAKKERRLNTERSVVEKPRRKKKEKKDLIFFDPKARLNHPPPMFGNIMETERKRRRIKK